MPTLFVIKSTLPFSHRHDHGRLNRLTHDAEKGISFLSDAENSALTRLRQLDKIVQKHSQSLSLVCCFCCFDEKLYQSIKVFLFNFWKFFKSFISLKLKTSDGLNIIHIKSASDALTNIWTMRYKKSLSIYLVWHLKNIFFL